MKLFNALIRTHHITSRKKVAKLKQAAANNNVYALLRSGGPPGIMYVEGDELGVKAWVETVHNLRYKDYQLAIKPAQVAADIKTSPWTSSLGSLRELDTVKDFSEAMKARQIYDWWRRGMGYDNQSLQESSSANS